MGCDIHFVVECNLAEREDHPPRWVGVYSTCHTPNMARSPHDLREWREPWCCARNYEFFAALAGVRGPGPAPNGVPDDASELTRLCLQRWGLDAHSCGHMSLTEFVQRKMDTNADAVAAAEVTMRLTKDPDYHYPWEAKASEPMVNRLAGCLTYFTRDYRVVFWFDS